MLICQLNAIKPVHRMMSLLALPLLLLLCLRCSSEVATDLCPVKEEGQCRVEGDTCSIHLSDEGEKINGACVNSRCRCYSDAGGGWDPCTCLPLVGDCRVEKNSLNAVGMPIKTKWDHSLYSCTPTGSRLNCRQEVHVVANYDGGPSSVVPVSVTMDSTRSSSKPVVLVLMNSKPIHWMLDIPDYVTVQRVILTGRSPEGSNVSYTRSKADTVSIPNTSLFFGYGPDIGTPQALNYIQTCFGPIASFSGVHSSNGWTLNISRSSEEGCEAPRSTQDQPFDAQCLTTIVTPTSLTPSSPPTIPLGTLRLSEGGVCSGQIQLFASCAKYPQWLHLASGSFGIEEGKVACRQLGCPSGAVAITTAVTRIYGEYIETSFKCQGSEDHLLSCASSSNETCHTQDNSTVNVVMLSCTNGGNGGQEDTITGTAELPPTSQSSKGAVVGQTKNGSGTYSDARAEQHATQMVTGTSFVLISPTPSAHRASTLYTHSGASSATKASVLDPRNSLVSQTSGSEFTSSTKLLDNLNLKKGPTVADGTSENGSPTSKYVAGSVMALILALMVFSAVSMSIYYHAKKRRREHRERPEVRPNETGESTLSRSESVHTNARLFIADQRCAEESASLGCSEPPPSYLSVAVSEPPPPAYETVVQRRPAIVLSESVQTVV